MNKTVIKNFAIRARVQLIDAVKQKAFEYEITEDGENNADIDAIGGIPLSAEEKDQRRLLIEHIRQKGYAQVMEEAAYTWFNRFIALRFMEVNGYLPSKIRVFTDENGAFKPEILKEAISAPFDGLDRSKILELLDKQNNEELYKYLIITQCNALNGGLPYMFERIANWTELLFPANLLRSDSVIGQMISEIPEEDWTDQVQIIGWMYQYYNAELKDDTFALLKKNVKITKERIPAATQLFTPDWIVRYMVENSLGRIYVNEELGIRSEELSEDDRIAKEKAIAKEMRWEYYIPEAKQEPEVRKQLHIANSSFLNDFDLKNIKIIDPCMGSGHILVYAFDVLMQIYTSAGWSERDAAKSILENNLYGLDIDDRAGQLAYFAVMMKARKYSRRILNGETKPNLLAIQDSSFMTDDLIAYVAGKDETIKADLVMLRKTFRDAKEYGSILNVPPMQYESIYERIDILNRSYAEDMFQSKYNRIAVEQLLPLVKQSQIMAQKYDVVVTNPPYMAVSNAAAKVQDYIKKNYPDSKSDLFAVFIERCGQFIKQNGYQAMITQHSWMFLSSFEKLRSKLQAVDTVNMAHLGARAFEEIGGEVVQTTSFVIQNRHIKNYKGTYCRLIEPNTQQGKEDMFLSGENRYTTAQDNFSKIPGSPVAYWASQAVTKCFASNNTIENCAFPRQGLATGNNELFLRLWFEPNVSDVMFNAIDHDSFFASGMKFIPYNKGGLYRKWYANIEWLIRFDKPHYDILQTVGNHLPSKEFYFRECITWSKVTSGGLSMRYIPHGSTFDVAGCSIFANNNLQYILAFTNTKIMQHLMNILSQTLNYEVGNVKSMPLIVCEKSKNSIETTVSKNLQISKTDLDSYETSWDFKKHPLV